MKLTDREVIAARDYGRKTGDFTEEALATEVLESRAEINRLVQDGERTWNAIPDRFKLSPSDGGGYDPWDAISDMVAEIAAKDAKIERLKYTWGGWAADRQTELDAARARVAELEALLDEDNLTDIITDSIDLDWTPRDAAKAIVRAMGGDGT